MLIRLSQWARPLLVWWWKGDRFTDPIDGRSYRKFLPYGYQVQRANALSPGTLSLERHRLLWLYLQDKTDFFTAEHKVLHLAPEQCFVKRFRKWRVFTRLLTLILFRNLLRNIVKKSICFC